MSAGVPRPKSGERPAEYASRLGLWFADNVPVSVRKELGQFLTPPEIAEYMAQLGIESVAEEFRLLDPGAGTGILSCAACEWLVSRNSGLRLIDVIAYEIDDQLQGLLRRAYSYLAEYMSARGVTVRVSLRRTDFVLSNARLLRLHARETKFTDLFDAVILNPPYFKLSKLDPRALAAKTIVYGQPNIYFLFLAISACLLKEGGRLVAIVPRSFSSGQYFIAFRQFFFTIMEPMAIHLFSSRRAQFSRDNILQETLILAAKRTNGWLSGLNGQLVPVSESSDGKDLDSSCTKFEPLSRLLEISENEYLLRIPAISEESSAEVSIADRFSATLGSHGWEASTGQIVPHRPNILGAIARSGSVPKRHVPLLWMGNVQTLSIVKWSSMASGKPAYIKNLKRLQHLFLQDGNYVLVRRFSFVREGKFSLKAAAILKGHFESPHFAVENHLNYVYGKHRELTKEESWGLAAYLNSTAVEKYLRVISGSTQVGVTELRKLPLPPVGFLRKLGRVAMASSERERMRLVDKALDWELNGPVDWAPTRSSDF